MKGPVHEHDATALKRIQFWLKKVSTIEEAEARDVSN